MRKTALVLCFLAVLIVGVAPDVRAAAYSQNFETGWTTVTFGSQTNADGWIVSDGWVRSGGGPGYTPAPPEGSSACYLNDLEGDTPPPPYIQSPALTSGVGALALYSRCKAFPPQEVTIYASTNGMDWTPHAVITNEVTGSWPLSSVVLNLYGTQYLRISKTADPGNVGAYFGIDDIQISIPPSYVDVTGVAISPQQPVILTPTTNTATIIPYQGAANLQPVLWFSTDSGDTFNPNVLLGPGLSNNFVTTFPGIPSQSAPGTVVDYYIKTVFDDQVQPTRTNWWPVGAPGVTTNFVVDWRPEHIFTNMLYEGWNLINGLIYQNAAWFNVMAEGEPPALISQTAYPNGIGTITIEARNNLSTNPIVFDIQRSTDGIAWTTTLATITNRTTTFTNHTIVVNHYAAAYLRIIKVDDDDTAYHHLVINDLSVTEPASFVTLSNPTLAPTPPLAGGASDITITIEPFAGANNIFAKLYYAFNSTNRPFTSFTDMELIGNNQYRTIAPITISVPPGETLNYYVVATFQGVNPDSPVSAPSGSVYTDLVRALPPVATYTNVSVAGDAATNLFLATDHLWRGVVDARTGLTNPVVYFQTETSTWGDALQSSNQTPFVGDAEISETISVQESLDRYLYFSFTDTVSNEAYQVSECEYVNFNDWNETSYGNHTNADGWNLNGGRMSNGSSNETGRAFDGRYAIIKYDQTNQYLRSPALPGGLGAISFWYRDWHNDGSAPAGFRIEKSVGPSGPWSSIATITNILSPDWLYFSLPVADDTATYVRIRNASDIETQSWLCLEEVAVTEPGSSVSFGTATNSPAAPILGDPVTVSVPVTTQRGATNLVCTVHYRSGSSAPFSTLGATLNGGILSTVIPPSPAGEIQYYFLCTYDGIEPAPRTDPDNAPATVHSFTIANVLPSGRFQNFDDSPGWTIGTVFTTETYNAWTTWDARVHTGAGPGGKPPFSPPNKCDLNAIIDPGLAGVPWLQSPLTSNGIGSITFVARSKTDIESQIYEVQTLPDGGATWTTVARYTNSTEYYVTNSVYLNTYEDIYARIIKISDGNRPGQVLLLDDILITYPPSDALISNVYHQPAYPAQNEALTVYCEMTQINPNYPAFGFVPKIIHRRAASGTWSTNTMWSIGGTAYAGTIPAYQPGNIEYYIRCDFDGVFYQSGNYSESRSPAFSPDAAHTELLPATFHSYNVRYYRSNYDTVSITGNFETVESELIGNDTWQGLLYVSGTNRLELGLDGLGYAANSQQSPSSTHWGDSAQWLTQLPTIGTLNQNGSNIVATGTFDGYYLVRFDLRSGEYRILAADWQDFDSWPLHATLFAEGSKGNNSTSTQQKFNGWTLSSDEMHDTSFLTGGWTNYIGNWKDDAENGGDFWLADKFRISNAHSNGNPRLEFRPTAGEGQLRPAPFALKNFPLRGAGTMSFKYRATDTNTYETICTEPGGNNWTNYTYEAVISGLGDNTDAGCYWSLIYRYVDSSNFYEMRTITTNQTQLVMAIYKHTAGVVSMLGVPSAPFTGRLNDGGTIKVTVATVSGKVNHNGYFNGGSVKVQYLDETVAPIGKGRIGLSAYDVNMVVTTINVTGDATYLETFTSTPSGWPIAGAWTFDVNTGTYRRVGRYTGGGLGFTVFSSLLAGNEFNLLGAPFWTAHKAYTNITTLGYTETSADIHRPETIVSPILKHTTGYGSLRFDDMEMTSWQGDNLTNGSGSAAWLMFGGWIGNDNPYDSRYCELRASRGMFATNYNQYLRSPLMQTAGPITFMYRTLPTGPGPQIDIRWAPQGSPTAFTSVTNVTLPLSEEWARFAYPINVSSSGYIQLAHISTDPNTRLFVDDLTFFDYHEADTNTWIAYNALLTDQQQDKLFLVEGQSGYLNYDDDTETLYNRVFTNAPYIRSPFLANGIGEISFWYRNWHIDGGLDHSTLVIETSPDAQTWTPFATLLVDSDIYTRYLLSLYDTENHFVRFRNDTNGVPDRLCLDSILVASPIATDLVVSNAWTIPAVPVFSDTVKIRAELTDYILGPSNVHVQAYYHVGSDNWATWSENSPLEMTLIDENTNASPPVYTYETVNSIPSYPTDTVVQYLVRAEFGGELFADVTSPRRFKDAFVNPTVYEPADYNEQYGNGTNRTPYYVVYSCPPGSVWINEINILENTYPWGNYEYIELCGLSGIDLAGWRLVTEDTDFNTNGVYTISVNSELGWDTNGFGFWMLGDAALSPDQTFTNLPDAEGNNLPQTGGISLYRSMGALEMAVSYYTEFGSQFDALAMTNRGFACIDIADSWLDTEPLALIGTGSAVGDFIWSASSGGYSPGSENYSQILVNVNDLPTVVVITAYWNDTTNTWLAFTTTPRDITNAATWYSTNLLVSNWFPVSNGHYSGSAGSYTQGFDRMTNSPVYFYRIDAQDDQ